MPRLTVKSYAELIHTPLYGQMRILHEQKYPTQAPGIFKVRYYRPALRLMNRYFRHGNNPTEIPTSALLIPGCTGAQHQRQNNWRALQAFMDSSQSDRILTMSQTNTYDLTLGNITLRSTPDFTGLDTHTNEVHYLFFDCGQQGPEDPTELEILRTMAELFHHVLTENGIDCPLKRVEYVHLQSDTVFRWNGNPRKRTIQRAENTAGAIATLWDSI